MKTFVFDLSKVNTRKISSFAVFKIEAKLNFPFLITKLYFLTKKELLENNFLKHTKIINDLAFYEKQTNFFDFEKDFLFFIKNFKGKSLVVYDAKQMEIPLLSFFFKNSFKNTKSIKKIFNLDFFDIADIFGQKKVKLSFLHKAIFDEEKDDIFALYNVASFFEKNELSTTTGSIALSFLKRVLKNKKFVVNLPAPIFFLGGFCHKFTNERSFLKTSIFDINSLYPYVLLNFNIFPSSISPQVLSKQELDTLIHLFFSFDVFGGKEVLDKNIQVFPFSLIKVKRVLWDLPFPFYTRRKDKGEHEIREGDVVFVTGYEHAFLRFLDYKLLYSFSFPFKNFPNFQDEIKKLYFLKKNAKNSAMRFLNKLILNSIFGIFGKYFYSLQKDLDENSFDFFSKGAKKIFSSFYSSYYKNYVIFNKTFSGSYFSFFSLPPTAALITSISRTIIFLEILKCLKNNIRVFYSDTDSIFIDQNDKDKFFSLFKVDDEIGNFKFEGDFEIFFKDKKIYFIKEKGLVCPGFERFMKKDFMEIFYIDDSYYPVYIKKRAPQILNTLSARLSYFL